MGKARRILEILPIMGGNEGLCYNLHVAIVLGDDSCGIGPNIAILYITSSFKNKNFWTPVA